MSNEKARRFRPPSIRTWIHHHLVDEITMVVLIGAGMLGVALTEISPARIHAYWLVMAAVFYSASLISERHHVFAGHYDWKRVIWNHALQWLAVVGAIELIYEMLRTGRLNNESTALMLLLLFALSTFITGIRLGWLYLLVGLFLGISVVALVLVERYLWFSAILGLVFLVAHHFLRRHRSSTKPEQRRG